MKKLIIPIIVVILIITGIVVYNISKLEESTIPITPLPVVQPSVPKEPSGEIHASVVKSIRTTPAGIEIEVVSAKEFSVRNELAVLRIGAQEFTLSRYPEGGDIHTLIFTLTSQEFAKTTTGELVRVQYGSGDKPYEQWNLGTLDKGLLGAVGQTPPTNAGAELSKLHVSGNRIVNEGGQEIRLRGVNFEDPFMLAKDDQNDTSLPDHHFGSIAKDFVRVKALGANIVRLPLYPGYYRLIGDEKYLATYVDRMVDLAEQNGLYVSISYHAIGRPGGWYDTGGDDALSYLGYTSKVHYSDSDMAVAFWNKVAARYGQRKHVLFEMYNEPADETADFTWTDWRPTGELLIATIRRHSDNIILGPGVKYTSDLSDVPKNPYSDPNLVYVAHVYPDNMDWSSSSKISEWERLFGSLAKTYPVIVTEWGFMNEPKYGETTKGTLRGFGKPLLDYLDQKNLSWIAYGYFPPDGEPPMLEKDWTTLNEFGKFVKERLQTSIQNVAPSPSTP